MKTILCAVDESTGAAEAVAVATSLSAQLGLRLVLAHVVTSYSPSNDRGVGCQPALVAGAQLLERVARKHGLDDRADRRAEAGDLVSELSRIAGEEAAVLILVGSSGVYRRRRFVLGRLSADLASTAPCPVVFVPPRPRR